MSSVLHAAKVASRSRVIGEVPAKEPKVKMVPEADYKRLEVRAQQEKEEAYKNGHSDGHQMGLSKGMEQANRIAANFNNLINDINRQREEIYREAELEVIGLVIALARKIIMAKAETDPEIVIGSVQRAIQLLLEKSKLHIKVSPDQIEFVRENLNRLYEMDDSIQRIELEPDRRVGVGGCIVETEAGNVDARIEKEFDNIADAIREVNRRSREEL